MAVNVITHGFLKDRKKHALDIRVVNKDDEVTLRIRDDCKAFEPTEHLDIIEPEDPAKNCGIRLVYGIAREVVYQNLLGLNVLTIHI